MRPLSRLFRLPQATAGTSAIEFALVAPAFCLMFFGVIEFGRLYWVHTAMQYAVQAAARCASLGMAQCTSPADTQSYAASSLTGPSIAAGSFAVSACAHNGAEVSIAMPFTFILKNLFPWQLTLTAQSCYPGAQS